MSKKTARKYAELQKTSEVEKPLLDQFGTGNGANFSVAIVCCGSKCMFERLTYWEGTIKAFPCGRKPLVLKVTFDLQFPRMVHFQLQCRRLTTSLAYSLALRSPWAETGEKNHVTHKFTPRKLYKLDLFWRKLKCRFFQVVSSLPSPPGLASAAGATATSLR